MAAMRRPGRLICHGCGDDIAATQPGDEAGVWLYECPACLDVDGQLTIELRVDRPSQRGSRATSGVMADLGVYDGILEALGRRPGQWLEFAVVEHLYAQVEPLAYRELVERYGHVAIMPDTHTASWMLGRAAWTLFHGNEVKSRRMGRGTGRWAYLSSCRAWTLPTTPDAVETLTWEAFSLQEGFSPHSHPAIDWRDTPNAAQP